MEGGNTFSDVAPVPGLCWDSVKYRPGTWNLLEMAWTSEGVSNPYEEMAKLFKAMIYERRLYNDQLSISQIYCQEMFLNAISAPFNWAKRLSQSILCELILNLVAAREQFHIYRQNRPTQTYLPDSTLALNVQQFMDLYKIRTNKNLAPPVSPMPKAATPGLVLSPRKRRFAGNQQEEAIDSDGSEIYRKRSEMVLPIRKRRMSSNVQEVEQVGGSGAKATGLPLRPKEAKADKKKKSGVGRHLSSHPFGPFFT
ncbi:hypothetical protein F4805DRAFT_476238 [Annulohypoxylon moriforme]|nr:hypothetical protein F4805DRAFT_476238 [Annulohypoxylon moriforme]